MRLIFEILNLPQWVPIHFCATFYMLAIIIYSQTSVYTLFPYVGREVFTDYHQRYVRSTLLPVGVPMLIEAGSGLVLLFQALQGSSILSGESFFVSLMLLVAVWIITFCFAVPLHHRLRRGYDQGIIKMLIYAHGARMTAWILRAVSLSLSGSFSA